MRSFYAILILLLTSAVVDAQSVPASVILEGPTSVYVGQKKSYIIRFKNSLNQDIIAPDYGEWNWVPSFGSVTNQTVNSADVTWQTAGTFRFDYTWETNGIFTQSHIMVTVMEIPDVNTQFTFDYNCGNTVVHRTSNPPNGFEWVWTSSATDSRPPFILGTGESVTRTTSTQIYLRARVTGSFIYGDALAVPAFIIYTAAPSTPSVAHSVRRFGPGMATISVDAVAGATGYRWYTGDGTLVSGQTSNTLIIENLSVPSIYTVSAVNGPCESGKLSVTATLEPLPVISADCGSTVSLNQPVNLTTIGEYDSYSWVNSSTGETGTGPIFAVHAPGTITVTVTKSGVTGPGTSAPFVTMSGLEGQQSINYIASNVIQRKGVAEGGESALDAQSLSQAVQYFDGLGRPIQTVATQGSPQGKDVVQPIVYDAAGREFRKYLPVVVCSTDGWYKSDLINSSTGDYAGLAKDFYSQQDDKIVDDARPFTETIFEPSPLNRPTKHFGAGADWADNNKFIGYAYGVNIFGSGPGQEKVVAYTLDENGNLSRQAPRTGSIETGGYYSSGRLLINVSTDEDGNIVREYTTNSGKVALKKVQVIVGSADLNNISEWAFTYYVYDDFGNLVTVVPPEAVKVLGN